MGSKKHRNPALYGIFGASLLVLLYFSILSLANSFDHAIDSFLEMWYWIVLLVAGFGVQTGLYFHIRAARMTEGAATTVAAAAFPPPR